MATDDVHEPVLLFKRDVEVISNVHFSRLMDVKDKTAKDVESQGDSENVQESPDFFSKPYVLAYLDRAVENFIKMRHVINDIPSFALLTPPPPHGNENIGGNRPSEVVRKVLDDLDGDGEDGGEDGDGENGDTGSDGDEGGNGDGEDGGEDGDGENGDTGSDGDEGETKSEGEDEETETDEVEEANVSKGQGGGTETSNIEGDQSKDADHVNKSSKVTESTNPVVDHVDKVVEVSGDKGLKKVDDHTVKDGSSKKKMVEHA